MQRKITLLIIMLLLVPIAAVAASYTVNGDGTVTDNVTGLMWQQEDDNTVRIWEEAIIYCESLSLSTYSDWRLPNISELHSIVDSSKFDPSIDSIAFQNNGLPYWSSTTFVNSPTDAWYVDFTAGYSIYKTKASNYYVRCVRAGQ